MSVRAVTAAPALGALYLLILAGCGGAGAAPPAPDGVVPAPSSTIDADCTTSGRWDLAITTEGGCPLPTRLVLVDGRGHTPAAGRVPEMDWTLAASSPLDGICRYRLGGRAGRLFRVDAELRTLGSVVIGAGHATPGETRYGCAAAVRLSGRRRRGGPDVSPGAGR